jgi:hypothetical protein
METCTCVCDVWNLYRNIILLFTYLSIYVFIVISVQGSEDCVTRFSVNKKQCVTARTNQLMHVDNIIYHKKHRHVNIGLFLLKRQCHEIFDIRFFHESVSSKPLSIPLELFIVSRKFAEIFPAQGAPPVSLSPVANGKSLQSEKFYYFVWTVVDLTYR